MTKLDPFDETDLRAVYVWATAVLRRMTDVGVVVRRVVDEGEDCDRRGVGEHPRGRRTGGGRASGPRFMKSSSEWTITELEPPSRLVHEGREPTMESRFTWTLEEIAPASTRLSQIGDFVMMPRFRPLGWLIETIVGKRMLTRETDRMLGDIKRIVEAEAATATRTG